VRFCVVSCELKQRYRLKYFEILAFSTLVANKVCSVGVESALSKWACLSELDIEKYFPSDTAERTTPFTQDIQYYIANMSATQLLNPKAESRVGCTPGPTIA
jgi:hypothetical protein